MGVYLSSPITDKNSIDGQCESFIYGASSMQGWRVNQEDAHNCIPLFDEKTKTSFFAVYDGHGGSEVASYCERHFPEFVKNLMKIHDGAGGDPTLFIKNAFLAFDATLTNEDVIKELKQLAGKDGDNKKDEEDDPLDRSETDLLKEEDKLPLDHLSAQYKSSTPKDVKNVQNENIFQSPAVSKRGSAATPDVRTSSQSAENGLHSESFLSTSSSLSLPSLQDCSSEASNDVLGVTNSSMTISSQTEDTVNTDSGNNESSVNNNNNVDKVANPPTLTNISPAVVSDTVLPSLSEEDKAANNLSHNGEEANDIHPAVSCTSSSSSHPDGSSREALSSLNSDVEHPGSEKSSNEDVTSSKSKATGDMADGDTSEDEKEEDEDLWEDMSEEDDNDEEDEDGPERNVPMMDMSNEEPGSDSGCTACVVLMQDKKLIVANAGDSRCVLSRAGKAIDLSVDHKPEDDSERKRIIKAGGKVTADGRVNGGLNLSRAIGDHVYKRNKVLSAKEQMITALPDIETAELRDEDQFIVIACDGIWNYLTSQEVVDYVLEKLKDPENSRKPSLICEQLFDRCLAPNTYGDGTGCDNMTCIIVILDTFIKSNAQQKVTEATDNKTTSHKNDETCSEQRFSNIKDKEDAVSGSLKRCADSVEVPDGKRMKIEEEVA